MNNAHGSSHYEEEIKKGLRLLFPGALVYLFGSRARKTNRPGSDFDLAIDASEPIPHKILTASRAYLDALCIPYNIDLIDLNSIQKDFKEQVMKDAILWIK